MSKYAVNQGFKSLSTYYLENDRHLARLHRRRRRAYVPTSNTASHDNHEKITSWVTFSFLYGYGAPLGGPSGHRSSAINLSYACVIGVVRQRSERTFKWSYPSWEMEITFDCRWVRINALQRQQRFLAYGWRAGNLNWPIRIEQVGKKFTVLKSM